MNYKVEQVLIPQTVLVRKTPVDIAKLQQILKQKKHLLGLTNTEISEVLAIPITQVEHYFRTDKYFAIPSPDVWKDLSALLQISDEELDSQINSVEEVLGKFDMSERHYLASGLSPTITAAGEIKIIYAIQNKPR